MLSDAIYCYVEYHIVECCYAECHYAECRAVIFSGLRKRCYVILSTWHFVNLTFCQLDILSTWHFVKSLFLYYEKGYNMDRERRNTNWRVRLSTVDLLIKVACFCKKIENISIVKSSWSKLISVRRSNVLNLHFSVFSSHK